jgi:hypothetical protein
MDGVYQILNHVTGDNLYTHTLPRACRFARPLILEAYPELAKANTPEADSDLTKRIEEATEIGGNLKGAIGLWLSSLDLPMAYDIESHSDSWIVLDPMEELSSMAGSEKIIAVKI